jgi:hypothetical protein
MSIPIFDGRFPANNMFTSALANSKTLVVDFLLERDMIDITTCCRRPLESVTGGAYTTTGKLALRNRHGGGSPASGNFEKFFQGNSPSKRDPNMASFKLLPAASIN